jgi:hypothetical protein
MKAIKILPLGVVLVIGAVAWLAMNRAIEGVVAPVSREAALAPVIRFVKIGEGGHGTVVWLTSTAPEDCAQVIDARRRRGLRRIDDLARSAARNLPFAEDAGDACTPFRVGEVADGTRVDVLGDCGWLAKIKILSGSLQGREGCIERDGLSEVADREAEAAVSTYP